MSKFNKILNYFSSEVIKKKLVNFQRIIELLSKSSSKYGPGIRNKPIPDPGSRGQKGTGSRIRIRNTGRLLFFTTSVHSLTVDKVIHSLFSAPADSRQEQPHLLCSTTHTVADTGAIFFRTQKRVREGGGEWNHQGTSVVY